MQLKISNADGTKVFSDDVVSVSVDTNNKITAVTYGSTTVSLIAAYNGANAKYEVGRLTDTGIMQAWLSN